MKPERLRSLNMLLICEVGGRPHGAWLCWSSSWSEGCHIFSYKQTAAFLCKYIYLKNIYIYSCHPAACGTSPVGWGMQLDRWWIQRIQHSPISWAVCVTDECWLCSPLQDGACTNGAVQDEGSIEEAWNLGQAYAELMWLEWFDSLSRAMLGRVVLVNRKLSRRHCCSRCQIVVWTHQNLGQQSHVM